MANITGVVIADVCRFGKGQDPNQPGKIMSHHLVSPLGSAPSRDGVGSGRLVLRLRALLREWRWRRRGWHTLRGLSAHALADIGLSRTDARQHPRDARTHLEERHWWI